MSMQNSEAFSIIEKHQQDSIYVVKDLDEKARLVKALRHVFELNADTYILRIMFSGEALNK